MTLVALSVHTSGRYEPLALAKPATAPDSSQVGVVDTANTVPDVPSEIATSPLREAEPERGAHVVAAAGPDQHLARQAELGRARRR